MATVNILLQKLLPQSHSQPIYIINSDIDWGSTGIHCTSFYKHTCSVLNRNVYYHSCATKRNTWNAPPGKFWFEMLRNALQRPCFCTWKDICERPRLKCTNSIWRPYFKVAESLGGIVIVWSFCGLLIGYSFSQLNQKKCLLQKQL